MRIGRATVASILLASLLVLGGCKKKKPAVPPPQAQAPTITQPEPEAQPAPAASEPNRPQPETKEPEAAPATTAPPAPKPKTKPRPTAKKPPPPPVEKPPEKTESKPSKTVVPEGGTQPASPQLSPTMPGGQAIQQKQNTNQLLETTEYNLKNITRALNPDEQAMVQHIRSYMQQARDANRDGDTERAYNLALKAHLLCDELRKR
jgi:outer membrane biosynthesis protein TonB